MFHMTVWEFYPQNWQFVVQASWPIALKHNPLSAAIHLHIQECRRRRFHIDGQVHYAVAHPLYCPLSRWGLLDPIKLSVIFVNENENKNGEKQENNEFVNEN